MIGRRFTEYRDARRDAACSGVWSKLAMKLRTVPMERTEVLQPKDFQPRKTWPKGLHEKSKEGYFEVEGKDPIVGTGDC